MLINKKINLNQKLVKKLNEITLKSKDDVFLWKTAIIFILILMTISVIYFIRLNYFQTNTLLDKTTETLINTHNYSIENIDMEAFNKASALIEYKKTHLTLPDNLRNLFFYEIYEEVYKKIIESDPPTSSVEELL